MFYCCENCFFLLQATVRQIEATDAMSARSATIIVSEPSPNIEPVLFGASVSTICAAFLLLKVALPNSQSMELKPAPELLKKKVSSRVKHDIIYHQGMTNLLQILYFMLQICVSITKVAFYYSKINLY